MQCYNICSSKGQCIFCRAGWKQATFSTALIYTVICTFFYSTYVFFLHIYIFVMYDVLLGCDVQSVTPPVWPQLWECHQWHLYQAKIWNDLSIVAVNHRLIDGQIDICNISIHTYRPTYIHTCIRIHLLSFNHA